MRGLIASIAGRDVTRIGQPPEQRNLLGSLQPPALPETFEPGAIGPTAAILALIKHGRRLTAAEKNAAKRMFWRQLRDRDAKQSDPANTPSPFLSGSALPSSWAGAHFEPPAGAACGRCRGVRFWREATEPKGWRCAVCHPPPFGLETTEVNTDAC